MAKYSFEFKKKVVQEYLDGKGSYEFLANKYEMKACSNIKKWVSVFRKFGDEGLIRSRKNKSYSFTYKLYVVEENAYLKELRRLRLEEETLLKKQRQSSTVSEENSN